jgi:hypothetical protein
MQPQATEHAYHQHVSFVHNDNVPSESKDYERIKRRILIAAGIIEVVGVALVMVSLIFIK